MVLPKYSMIKNTGLNIKSIYSFQALSDLIDNNKNKQQFVKQLEERKRFLIKEYESGALTAEKYKGLI